MSFNSYLQNSPSGHPLLFVLGFMGAGKSTLGKMVARHLNWTFIDLDDEIEGEEGKAISALFADSGEAHFRTLERNILEKVVSTLDSPTLLSCGGGTPCYSDNMEWMKAKGLTIYLKTPTPIIIGRLRRMRASRPMLSKYSDEELPAFIHSLLAQREPYYSRAHIVLDNPKIDKQSILHAIKTYFPIDT